MVHSTVQHSRAAGMPSPGQHCSRSSCVLSPLRPTSHNAARAQQTLLDSPSKFCNCSCCCALAFLAAICHIHLGTCGPIPAHAHWGFSQSSLCLYVLPCCCHWAFCTLQFLHAHSIIYCDIKPSNILLDENGRLKLGGFGLSRRLSDINKTPVTNLPPVSRAMMCCAVLCCAIHAGSLGFVDNNPRQQHLSAPAARMCPC